MLPASIFAASLVAALLGFAGPPEPAPAPAPAPPPAPASEPEPEPQPELHRVVSLELDAPADALARAHVWAPGLTLSSPGGLGRYSAVPLRRGGSLAVPVYVDGALLSEGVAGPVDLASVPVDGFGRVDVYRGFAPIRYGPTPVGGAVEFVGELHEGPARGWAQLGLGSVLAREARAGFAVAVRPHLSISGRADYAGARGGFWHFDDGGTRYLFGDDLVRRRASNFYDRAGASLRLDHRRGPVTASTLVFGRWQLAGVPAPNRSRPSDASYASASLRSITRVRRSIRGAAGQHGEFEWIANLGADGRLFRDREAALGSIADDERTVSVDVTISPRLRLPVWRQGWLALSGDLRGDWVDVRERVSELDPAQPSSGDARRGRMIAGLGLELEQWLWDRRWAFAPGVRVDVVASRFAEPPGEGEANDLGRNRTELSIGPRIATTFVLVDGLALHGSAGRTLRPPTLLELFGDRGVVRGNEGLRSAASSKIDGGVRYQTGEIGGHAIDLLAQATGFAAWTVDAIHFVRDSDRVLRPTNIEQTRVRGLELAASLRALGGDFGLDLSYSLVDGRNVSPTAQRGRFVPGLSVHNLLVRPSGGHRFITRNGVSVEPRLSYELEFASASVLDLDNRDMLPARLLHAVGLSLRLTEILLVSAEVRGLSHRYWADVDPGGWPGAYPVANADALGIPLPGPSLWTSVRVDLQRAR